MRQDLLPTTLDGKISKVLEECGEVIHAVGKYQRHGEVATDPKTQIKYYNLVDLYEELLDLRSSIEVLLNTLDDQENKTPCEQG